MDRTDWFTQLFGFAEADAADVRQRLVLEEVRGSWRLRSTVNCQSYGVGRFSNPSLAELMERAPSTGGAGSSTTTSSTSSLGAGGGGLLPSARLSMETATIDVSVLHARPENRHATFQVASQFNCLEFAHPSAVPEDGVTNYVHDKTQVVSQHLPLVLEIEHSKCRSCCVFF
jgi:hypothetical protein